MTPKNLLRDSRQAIQGKMPVPANGISFVRSSEQPELQDRNQSVLKI
jgi:hypothetical protein